MNEIHETFMRRAIALAEHGVMDGAGGPFGTVIVENEEVIAEGWNSVTSLNDPTAHAEIVAIRQACKKRDSFQLDGCTIYSSCEPCPMCLGAIYWARPKLLFFAASREDAAGAGFDDQFMYDEIGKDIGSRQIETRIILRADAKDVFRLWNEKEDKIAY